MRNLVFAGAVVALASSGAAQPADPLQIQEHELDNGFTILLAEDHRRPRVAANLWVRVGSMIEPVGQHGIVHFLEHVIHQGTTTVGTRDLAAELPILQEIHDTEQELIALRNRERNRLRERAVFYDELDWPMTPEMEALRQRLYELEDMDDEYRDFWTSYKWYMQSGGYVRHTDPVPASTEQDYMEMNMALPPEHLELFFRLEADRLVNAIQRGWESQRFTVVEQILGGKSRPQTRFNESIDGVTAQIHPVFVPDGGHIRDFGNFTRDATYRIYDDYFVPNNATLVLVGDVTMEEVVPLAERYFGVLPRGPEPPLDLDVEAEPMPTGSIRLDWTEPLSPQVHLRYRVPGMGHPDRPVFDLIAALLSGPHGMAGQELGGTAGFRLGRGRLPGHPHLPLRVARGVQPGGARGERRRPRGGRERAPGFGRRSAGGADRRRRLRAGEEAPPRRVGGVPRQHPGTRLPDRPPPHDEPLERAARTDRGARRGDAGGRAAGRRGLLRALQPGARDGPRRAPRGKRPELARLRMVEAAGGGAMRARSAGLQTGTRGGLERRSPDRHAQRSALRTSQLHSEEVVPASAWSATAEVALTAWNAGPAAGATRIAFRSHGPGLGRPRPDRLRR